MGLKAGIWASRLRYGPGGGGRGNRGVGGGGGGENSPVRKHRSLTPLGPLLKKYSHNDYAHYAHYAVCCSYVVHISYFPPNCFHQSLLFFIFVSSYRMQLNNFSALKNTAKLD